MRKKGLSILTALTGGVLALSCCMKTTEQRPANAAGSETKLIALTFDDGPNTTTTNDVLDLMEQYHAKASFFLIGDNISEESAKTVRRAYDMGMEIDNHSRTHSNMSKMTAEQMQAEIAYVNEKVLEITGEPTKFFRPPFIDVSQAMYDAIDLPFICGIDCQDYMENVTAQARADYIMNGAKDGVIVLLHDAAGNQQTVEALKIVMPKLIEQGYEFVTLTELFARQGETPQKNILYSGVAKYPAGYTQEQFASAEEAPQIVLDKSLLASLGDAYAVETEYASETGYPPVIALQKWSGDPTIWHTIQPYYFNGDRAVFLAQDIQDALAQFSVGYDDLDGISLTAYSGGITLKNVKISTKPETGKALAGDVNADGACDAADAVMLQKWLCTELGGTLADPKAGDLDSSGDLTAADLSLLKRNI